MVDETSHSTTNQLLEEQLQNFDSIDLVARSVSDAGTLSSARARARLDYITPLWERCRALHSQLLRSSDAALRSQLPYFTSKEFSAWELRMLDLLDLLHTSLQAPLAASSPLGHRSGDSTQDSPRAAVQVPRIKLPRFTGNYKDWSTFRDYFQSLFINDASYDNLQCLHYLNSCLEGEAASVIKNIPITANNFQIAWEALEKRFANKCHLVSAHLTTLFSASKIEKESPTELRRLLSSIVESVQSLKNIGRPVQSWDDILVHFAVSRLDRATRKAWELSLTDTRDYPAFSVLESFLENRIRALETVEAASARPSKTPHAPVKTSMPQVHHADHSSSKCPICKGGHNVFNCSHFKQASPLKRHELVKTASLCINCLAPGHVTKSCASKHNCRVCGNRHHSMLHRDSGSSCKAETKITTSDAPSKTIEISDDSVGSKSTNTPVTHFSNDARASGVVLATAWVLVSSLAGVTARVRVLLDQGSTHSLASDTLVDALHVPTSPINASLKGVGDTTAGHVSRVAHLNIAPISSPDDSFAVDALVIPSVTAYTPRFQHPWDSWHHLRGLPLADPEPSSTAPIQMILGADLYAYVLCAGLRRGAPGQPVAQKTKFGWVLSGGTGATSESAHVQICTHFSEAQNELDGAVRRFWEIEEVPHVKPSSELDSMCEAHFASTHSRTSEGRYVVRIPFSMDPPLPLGESRRHADRLLIGLERRLERNPEHRAMYVDYLREYERSGHMSAASDPERVVQPRVFLPHHPVLKTSSTTTKLRVVFNASSRTSTGKSVNELQLVGPRLQTELPLLLTRWRAYRFVFCADVAQMYRQVLVHEADRDYQCIRWRHDPSDPISTYRLNTLTFGMTSAAFLAQRVIKQLAHDEGMLFPLASPIVRDNFYVDDCLFGADDSQLALQTRDQVNALLSKGGFELRKWAANDSRLLDGIPVENHGHAIERAIQPDDSIKLLGLAWLPFSDVYRPVVQALIIDNVTKRTVLSAIARLYDPLGWLAPVVLVAKSFMQELWQLRFSWDQELPDELRDRWITFYEGLSALRDLSITRWTGNGSDTLRAELHGFADASEKAYAATIYVRVESYSGEVRVTLLMSKTRVAPLKQLSIPRLELCAAALLAELLSAVRSLPEYANLITHCWTDSTVVLSWLAQQSSHWKTFVANRVGLVHSLLPNLEWQHVVSADNPADCASRGASPAILVASTLWWSGPTWLTRPHDEWPSHKPPASDQCESEARVTTLNTTVSDDLIEGLVSRISSWNKLLRVLALILRWVPVRASRVAPRGPSVLSDEIARATQCLVKLLQTRQFSEELVALESALPISPRSPIASLNPILDSDGLIRVGGRLEQADLTSECKHPIILAPHPACRLLVAHAHQRALHAGVTLTLSTLRSQYWLIQARKTVRSVIFHCVQCARIKADLGQQLMGALPAPRVSRPDYPFQHCGVDYIGPLSVR